jgi:hypothetical protein
MARLTLGLLTLILVTELRQSYILSSDIMLRIEIVAMMKSFMLLLIAFLMLLLQKGVSYIYSSLTV